MRQWLFGLVIRVGLGIELIVAGAVLAVCGWLSRK